jgi:hypothetical protein
MVEKWFRVAKAQAPFAIRDDEPFARLLSEFDGRKLPMCVEIDGNIYLLEPKHFRTFHASRAFDVDATVAQVLRKLELKPFETTPAPGLKARTILKGFPQTQRTAVLKDGDWLEVWKRLAGADRGSGSVRGVGLEPPFSDIDIDEPVVVGAWPSDPLIAAEQDFEVGSIDLSEVFEREAERPTAGTEPEAASPLPPLDELGSPEGGNAGLPPGLVAESPVPDHPDVAVPKEPDGGRWINAVIKNHDVSKPLEKDWVYNLAISIDTDPEAGTGKLASAAADPGLRGGKTDYELVVELTVDDEEAWDLNVRRQKLRVGKDGLSIGEAAFQMTPMKEGRQAFSALIHRENNLIQRLDISVDVGIASPQGLTVTPLRKMLTFPKRGIRRDVSLIIEPKGAFYSVQAWGDHVSKFDIRLTPAELDKYIENARDALLGVVRLMDPAPTSVDQTYPFQYRIDIPSAIEQESLKRLAEAGQLLFYRIFFNHNASQQCKDFGNWLIKEADDGKNVCLQVNAELFPVPWAMLYPAIPFDPANVSWEIFLGMRCIIEQTPLRSTGFGCDPDILEGDTGLAVSLNLNLDIEGQKGYITRQVNYWNSVAGQRPMIRLMRRETAKDILDALASSKNDDQIIYMYCHADSVGLDAGAGPGDSSLTFTQQGRITLDALDQRAPVTIQFAGAPLVFINACESATPSTGFYTGFISYFVSRGARGVIGTECKVPALFAEEWAKRFFIKFLAGDDLGAVMLKLRQEFVNDHSNGLGLLYGLHCNADTQVAHRAA